MVVALGISGGIAAYKACEIIRGLDKAGVEVQTILSRGGARFITPLTLQTLSRNSVISDRSGPGDGGAVRHIDLTRRIDVFAVAPATANFLAKFARGIADDFLSTFYISVTSPVVLAPAMNSRMWDHPATRENLAILRARGTRIIEPESGWLAEEEQGVGRLADPERIVEVILEEAGRSSRLKGMHVVITAGPTREPLDPVRYLSNRSSGRMGFALASEAARRGARVTLIAGPVELETPAGVQRINVETSSEMRAAVFDAKFDADAVIMAAAVSDYIPPRSEEKIKKTAAELDLRLSRGPDILKELGENRGSELLVGFAAETENLLDNARIKLAAKNVDYIVANDVSIPGIGMEATENEVTILDRNGSLHKISRAAKGEIAGRILDHVLAGRPR
jgi:phosphopantothenoylcysteine decarboxylase/phosphopantothenate--cysteine ligase